MVYEQMTTHYVPQYLGTVITAKFEKCDLVDRDYSLTVYFMKARIVQ